MSEFPCPACGKATRVCQDPNLRICALCRKVSPAVQCTAALAPRLIPRRGAVDDTVGARDVAFGWIETEAAPNPFPCPACGKPTRVGQDPEERVCSLCRKVSPLAEIQDAISDEG